MHKRNLKNVLLVSGLIVASVLAVWLLSGPTPTQTVMFEVRAIDPSGHPVAGAEVWLQEQQVGVTDSFGVWRRTMRVDSGAEAKLLFKKKYSALHRRSPAGEYAGEKSFTVRSDESRRIQNHRGSLQLMPART